jgi:DNA-binding transcriptional LysR family regulator
MSHPPAAEPGSNGSEAALDSRRLHLFVVSAREQSFAVAASVLNLSPSAISHSMKALEQDLGCMLFRRIGPRVELTAAGQRLLPLAEGLLGQMQRLRQEVVALEAATRQLRVAVPAMVCSGLLPVVLPDFQDCFPSVQLQVLTGVEAAAAFAAGEVDLMLAPPAEVPAGMVQRELYKETLAIYVAPFHLLRQSGRPGRTALAKHLLLVTDDDARRRVIGAWTAEAGDAPDRIWLLPGLHSVRELARVGQGVAVLPDWTEGTAQEGLVRLPVPDLALERACVACWPREKPPAWAAEVLLSLIEMAAAERQGKKTG